MQSTNEALSLSLALLSGATLGVIFFAGLWWTVRYAIASKWVALWFIGSLLLRTSLTLGGFYLVARGDWGGDIWGNTWTDAGTRLLVCVGGFVMARLIVTRLTGAAGSASQPAKTSDAS
jgi:F1F0 ATPase subunit 2